MHLEREKAECGWIKIDQDERGLCAVVEKNIERWRRLETNRHVWIAIANPVKQS
jgi:hypothetical protein